MKYLVLLLLFSIKAFCVTLPIETSYKVNLTWNAPTWNDSSLFSHYNVYRADSGSNTFTNINSASTETYTDQGISNGLTYQYYVTSVDNTNTESIPSNTASVSVPFVPFPPTLGTLTTK